MEMIKGKMEIKNVIYYYVKWEGYPETDNTWEPIKNFHNIAHLKRLVEHFDFISFQVLEKRIRELNKSDLLEISPSHFEIREAKDFNEFNIPHISKTTISHMNPNRGKATKMNKIFNNPNFKEISTKSRNSESFETESKQSQVLGTLEMTFNSDIPNSLWSTTESCIFGKTTYSIPPIARSNHGSYESSTKSSISPNGCTQHMKQRQVDNLYERSSEDTLKKHIDSNDDSQLNGSGLRFNMSFEI